MADIMGALSTGLAQVQDTFGNSTIGNELLRAAALGKQPQGTYPIGFTSGNSEASLKNRVYIKVPDYYTPSGSLTAALSEQKGLGWQGIFFPVTPTIRQESKANWTASAPQHSNYAIYSYNNSDVGNISVSGQFPVQNSNEALYWTATVNALRALTKMRTGNDQVPGAPPPVCRFFAYGASVYENVPVVISDFSIELPADVDYISSTTVTGAPNKVPSLSTISMTLVPVYSRREMANFSVDKMVNGGLNGLGYL